MKGRPTFAVSMGVVLVLSVSSLIAKTKSSPFENSQTVFLSAAEGQKLWLATDASGNMSRDLGQLIDIMQQRRLKRASAELQILVSASGQVLGVQRISGTDAILAASVNEVMRRSYNPYVQSGVAVPFVTIVKMSYAAPPPMGCSLQNPKPCR